MLKDRLELAAIGGFAGLSLWAFFEYLPDAIGDGWGLHFALSFVMAFFVVLMALVGPEKPQRALLPSGIIALAVGLLALMGALRFETPKDFFEVGHTIVALSVFLFIAVPFAAAELEERNGWKQYTRLFDNAWGIFIRYFAGWLFAGLILLVLYLSDELLKLVGIRIIDDILGIDVVRYALIGAVFGLGVATVHELRDYVSPVLVHRLLRMLVPLVLVVVVVFLGALPFRGLSDLFGKLSTAAVLMSVAFGAITLITTLIDRDDESASEIRLMVMSARALAVLLPCLVALAIYAVWVRVVTYGWTPDRVIAAYVAFFLAIYAVSYAIAALRGAGWEGKMRRSNLYIALAVCAGAGLWLTPLISAEGLSAKSQVARFEAGKTETQELPLYQMAHKWGLPGERAISTLTETEEVELIALVEKAQKARSVWAYNKETDSERSEGLRASLVTRVAVKPAQTDVAALLVDMPLHALRQVDRLCKPGAQKTCVLVMMPEDGRGFTRNEAILLSSVDGSAWDMSRRGNELTLSGIAAYGPDKNPKSQPRDMFDRVMRGDFSLEPTSRVLLTFDETVLVPYQ